MLVFLILALVCLNLNAAKTKAVLEVRSHDVPFLIEDGQTICRLIYEPMAQKPMELYNLKEKEKIIINLKG